MNMANIETVNHCYGCKSCAYTCSVSAIKGIVDAEGFWYPHVASSICIDCGRCLLVCPRIYKKTSQGILYAGIKHISINKRRVATSGGFFDVVAQYFLDNGGVVFASTFDENMSVRYFRLDHIEDIKKYHGSKYVSSELSLSVITEMEEILKEKNVLFVGTPCQCAGIKNLFQHNDRLYILDFYCHGVPGPAIWEKYIKRLARRNGGKITDYQFRNKKDGWHNSGVYYCTQWGGIWKKIGEDIFTRWYFVKGMYRESCYYCQFRSIKRAGDITMGDFWGIEKIDPGFDDDLGVSLLSINSQKGMELWNAIKGKIIWKVYDVAAVPSVNYSLRTVPMGVIARRKIYQKLPLYPLFVLMSGFSKKCFFDGIIKWIRRK